MPLNVKPVMKLKITLTGSKPPIWRRLLVPPSTRLGDLHRIIQVSMGWYGMHLHLFQTADGTVFGDPQEDMDDMMGFREESSIPVESVLVREKQKLRYEYDFGDGWEHRIVVEATGLEETNPCPRLIDGAMACPPEDIGGTGGYAALKAATAGEKDVYGQELLEALGGEFDPEALDEEEIADMLEPIQAGFRRLGDTPSQSRPAQAPPLDMEQSLEAQGIHSIEELMQALQGEIDKNRK